VKVKAGGRIDSSKKTIIECELENIQFASQGNAINRGGSSTILEIVPEGAKVHENDVLCRLDSSDYEELVRQQLMKVEEAHTAHRRAELDLESAEAALREYRDGTVEQVKEQHLGGLALIRADIQRQKDRIAWSRRMAKIGYVTQSKLKDEELAQQRAEFNLGQAITNYELFEKYGLPNSLRVLQTRIDSLRTQLDFETLRVDRVESRLRKYQRQVEKCTVRAPHDGFVVYINQSVGGPKIEQGSFVRQKQGLFYLPDLAHMEVWTKLHESVVDTVRKGMSADVRVESLSRVKLEGHVIAVDYFPLPQLDGRESGEVKSYMGRIQLHAVPEGLRPGMTAEVDIVTAYKPKALVIPPDALAVEEGHDVCYVAHDETLERREVKLGQVTPELLEVTGGLEEGENVVLGPSRIEGIAAYASDLVSEVGPGTERPEPANR
jgi:HlyD family secretion protein